MTSSGHSMDVPFEHNPELWNTNLHTHLAGGLVVMAAVLDTDEAGKMPALVYRFAKPDGSGFYPDITLVVDEDQMTKLAQLTASATAASIKAAS